MKEFWKERGFHYLMAAAATHSVSVDHRDRSVNARLHRPCQDREENDWCTNAQSHEYAGCRWTATVIVNRTLDYGSDVPRLIDNDTRFSGSEAGACPRGDRLEQRTIAQNSERIQNALLAAAERDRAPMLAELDALHALSGG